MDRPLRIEIRDGVYHVTNRGLERRAIVQDDQDRRTWRRLLHRVAVRCGWRVFAYVLLDNHFHVFLRTPQPNLSAGMHDFQSGYATLFNARHDRVGPLFQGRFHAVIVESEGHAWEVSRYVHLNPVRANVTTNLDRYVWSSFPCYMNPMGAPAWLDWRAVLAEFSRNESAARLAYRRFVLAGIAQPPANPLLESTEDAILGSNAFVNQVRGMAAACDSQAASSTVPLTIDRIESVVAELFGVTSQRIRRPGRRSNQARDAVILLARDLLGESLASLAARLGGVGASTISEATRRARQHVESDSAFLELLERARHELGI